MNKYNANKMVGTRIVFVMAHSLCTQSVVNLWEGKRIQPMKFSLCQKKNSEHNTELALMSQQCMQYTPLAAKPLLSINTNNASHMRVRKAETRRKRLPAPIGNINATPYGLY